MFDIIHLPDSRAYAHVEERLAQRAQQGANRTNGFVQRTHLAEMRFDVGEVKHPFICIMTLI